MKKKQCTDLQVITIGNPLDAIENMDKFEKEMFYETLLNNIKKLKAEDDAKNLRAKSQTK